MGSEVCIRDRSKVFPRRPGEKSLPSVNRVSTNKCKSCWSVPVLIDVISMFWRRRVRCEHLPVTGIAMAEALLSWDPCRRPSLQDAVRQYAFLCPESFTLGGWVRAADGALEAATLKDFPGRRHRWNVIEGQLASELLDLMRSDPALCLDTEQFRDVGLDFHASRGKVKTKFGRKFILSGYMGDSACATGQCCGLSMTNPLTLPHLQAWFRALLDVNGDALKGIPVHIQQSSQPSLQMRERQRDFIHNPQHCTVAHPDSPM